MIPSGMIQTLLCRIVEGLKAYFLLEFGQGGLASSPYMTLLPKILFAAMLI